MRQKELVTSADILLIQQQIPQLESRNCHCGITDVCKDQDPTERSIQMHVVIANSKVSMCKKKLSHFCSYRLDFYEVKVVDIILQLFAEKGSEHKGCGERNNALFNQTQVLSFDYLHATRQQNISSYIYRQNCLHTFHLWVNHI